jgi:2-dehydropantoate 2-reductase
VASYGGIVDAAHRGSVDRIRSSDEQGGMRVAVYGARELDGSRSDRAQAIVEAFAAGGVDATVTTDIRAELWTKFSFICAVAGMTAAVRLPIGPIRDDPISWAMFRSVLDEVTTLARAEGVDLQPGLVERQLGLASGLAADSYSSLYHDLVNGRRMELEALHGIVVTRARAVGLPVPATHAIHAILHPWAERNQAMADA